MWNKVEEQNRYRIGVEDWLENLGNGLEHVRPDVSV